MEPDPDAVPRGGPKPGATRPEREGGGLLFAAVEASPLPMLLADPHRPDEPIVLANEAFARMTGYDRSEVLGRNCRFLQGPGSDPEAVDRIRHAIRWRTELAVEVLNYRKDGTPFRNALFLSPVFGAGGDLVYLLASQLDVSPRGAAEHEPVVGGLDRLAGEVAHDLNNLFQVVAGSVDVLKAHAAASGDARLIRRAEAVVEATARAAALTARLLAASRKQGNEVPAADPAPGRIAAPERPAGGDLPGRGSGGERILVVDDRAEIADLARTMLEHVGYAVEVARDGQQALDRLPEGFDLLFTDLVMPGPLDGVDLAREAQRRHPGLKVLLTTGYAEAGGEPAGRARRAFDTIAKPYRRADLADKVRRVLDGSSGIDRD